MMQWGVIRMAMPSVSVVPASTVNAWSIKPETLLVRDTHSHDVWNSRVESTMEMSLGDFIDPAHQGGHTHGSIFGNGKL